PQLRRGADRGRGGHGARLRPARGGQGGGRRHGDAEPDDVPDPDGAGRPRRHLDRARVRGGHGPVGRPGHRRAGDGADRAGDRHRGLRRRRGAGPPAADHTGAAVARHAGADDQPSPVTPTSPGTGSRVVHPDVFRRPSPEPTPSARALAPLVPLFVLDVLTAFTVGMLPPILPLVAAGWGLSTVEAGLVNTVYAIGLLSRSYPASRIRAPCGTR